MRIPENGVEAITGCVASGKSRKLIETVEMLKYGNKEYVLFKPEVDTRSPLNRISSKNGSELPAVEISVSKPELLLGKLEAYERNLGRKVDVIGFDEAQFVPAGTKMPEILFRLSRKGYRVIVAGLDLDFRALPFGMMSEILPLAYPVTKLLAVCECGNYARFSQRYIGDQLAPWDDILVKLGGVETYKPRCINCFVVPAKANGSRVHFVHAGS